MKKILIASLAVVGAFIASSANADQPSSTDPVGIECVRWNASALQINCNAHPWKWANRDPNVLTFTSVQDIYDHGYKVVAMREEVDSHGGQYSYTDYIIEKR